MSSPGPDWRYQSPRSLGPVKCRELRNLGYIWVKRVRRANGQTVRGHWRMRKGR